MRDEKKNEARKAEQVRRLCRFLFSVFLLSLLPACRPKPLPPPEGYFGPTLPMATVISAINENNRRLPTLWAEVERMRVSFVDDEGRRRTEQLDSGNLLYQAPRNLRLIGRKLVVGPVLDLGSNPEVYWLAIKEGPDTAWWGRYENIDKECSRSIPIRPDLLVEVLAITAFNPDFTVLPAPVMRFDNDADAYVFVWVERAPDRYIATREVWYDRATLRPQRVLLYDDEGRVLLRAFLREHEPVEVEGLPREQWPVVATEYDLFFPQSEARIALELGQILRSRRGAPSRATFTFSPEARRLGVSKVIQLDEPCGP